MILFEIHSFRDGKWKIGSVFDDKDLAIYEAQRMEKGGRFSAVRVVQETYDEETQRTGTVYRTTKVDRINVDVERKRAKPLSVAAPPKPPKPKKPKKPGISPVMLLLTLTAIVLGGIAVLSLLQNVSTKF